MNSSYFLSTLPKIVKQYHDNMISGREHGGIMVVKTLCSTLEGVFCNHSIKKNKKSFVK